jgi:hypothetical protein
VDQEERKGSFISTSTSKDYSVLLEIV